MNCKPILLMAGEPNSVFLEIFFKAIKKQNFKKPLILIASLNLVKLQMKKLNINKKIKLIDYKKYENYNLNNDQINLIDVNYNTAKAFEKISTKSNSYISRCFEISFELLKKGKIKRFINGPISKKTFLNKNYLGITEFLSKKFKIKKSAMLIFNKNLSVCPLTTHVPLKSVTKQINKKIIAEKIKLIDNFYRKFLKKKPKIAVVGLNPHCESVDIFNEDEKIIKPAVIKLKKQFYVSGPFPADTIFLKNNRKKFDVILGMYHDQVLGPLKTIYEYDAINITIGLPFIRISPDHGPNEKMLGKNISNPLSLIKAITFLDKH